MNNSDIGFQNEAIALEHADLLAEKIAGLELELKDNHPLLNQLHLASTNLERSRDFLSSNEHPIVFIGSIGVGKTTAICGIVDLVDAKGKTALSASSGRTTLCEVEIRQGNETRILISPCSTHDIHVYLREFVDVLQMSHEGTPSNDRPVSMTSEVERCVRNMIGLPKRKANASSTTGTRIDEALNLYIEMASPTAFLSEIERRMDLDLRETTELVCDDEDEIEWIRKNFALINNGNHPNTPFPKRIIIELCNPLLSEPRMRIILIDTKGLDGSVERADIDKHFRDHRAICVVCSKFNDAPEQSVQLLIKHLLASGLAEHLAQQTVMMILERNGEAESVMSDEGEVESSGQGREVRLDQVRDTLRTRLKIADKMFPQIIFYDAKQNDTKSIESSLVDTVLRMRRRHVDNVYEITSAVEQMTDSREQAQAKAAHETVAGFIYSWTKDSRKRQADIDQIYSPLVSDMTNTEVYASSVRASVNREGSWGNFDFYYKLETAARKKAVKSFGESVGEIQRLLDNIERQTHLAASHPFVRQLRQGVNAQVEHIYDSASSLGRSVYEASMRTDQPFWGNQQREWGRGPGYKGRVAQMTLAWFQDHTTDGTHVQIQEQIMKEWNDLITLVESYLVAKGD